MKRFKVFAALLLSLVMMASLLTACTSSNQESTTKAPETTAADSGEKTTAADDKTEAPETQDGGSEGMDLNGLKLPLSEEKAELTVWLVYSGTVVADINDIEGVKKMEELTNVHINWIPVNLQQIGDQYGILLSSGNYPDIIYASSVVYPGGFAKGIEDGIIYPDHDTLIRENMPNYMAYLNSSDEARREATADTGKMEVVKNIVGTVGKAESEGTFEGMSYRQDLLEKLGVDVPTTVDEWHDVLVKAKEAGIVEYPLMINPDGGSPISEAWGVTSRSANGFQVENDVVSYARSLEGFGEYLETMRQWYAEGLIDPNFTSFNFYPDTPGAVENNRCLLFSRTLSGFSGKAYKNNGMITNDEAFMQPVVAPVLKAGDTQKYQWGTRIIAKDPIYITTSCKDPVLAAKWLDFQYTTVGELLNWYGIEGETYEIGEDGKPYFTDTVVNAMAPKDILQKYCLNHGDCWLGKHCIEADWTLSEQRTGSNQQLYAVNIWSEPEVNLNLTASIALTEEEGDETNSALTALNTMSSEYAINYILGTESKSFEEYVDDLKNAGMDKVVAAYQAAYDRYLAR